MNKKLIALLLVVISIICDKGISVYAADITWPFHLRYHSSVYNEEDDSLKDSDYYKALIELCKADYYGNNLRRLTADASYKWLEQLLKVDNFLLKSIYYLYPFGDSLFMESSDENNVEQSDYLKNLRKPKDRMWNFIGNDYSRYRVINHLTTGIAVGYVFMEMFGDDVLESTSVEIHINAIIPENIGKPEDLDLDSTLKIVRFKVVYNLDQYLAQQESMNDSPEYQTRCDCESLRFWNVKEVEIEGDEVKVVDFLKGKVNLGISKQHVKN